VTNKPTPSGTSEAGSHPSLDNHPTLVPRGLTDATDRQNLADTLTVPLPPEQRARPRSTLEETQTPISSAPTPITETAPSPRLPPHNGPDPMSTASSDHAPTPHSADPRADSWFLATGQPAQRLQSEGSFPAPVASKRSALPVVIGGTVGIFLVLAFVGYLLFGA
jgi:hypothetical protein